MLAAVLLGRGGGRGSFHSLHVQHLEHQATVFLSPGPAVRSVLRVVIFLEGGGRGRMGCRCTNNPSPGAGCGHEAAQTGHQRWWVGGRGVGGEEGLGGSRCRLQTIRCTSYLLLSLSLSLCAWQGTALRPRLLFFNFVIEAWAAWAVPVLAAPLGAGLASLWRGHPRN